MAHKLYDIEDYMNSQADQWLCCKRIIYNLDKCATDVAFLKNRLFRACDEKTMKVIFDEVISAKCSLKLIASYIEDDLRKSAARHIERAIKRAGGDNERT